MDFHVLYWHWGQLHVCPLWVTWHLANLISVWCFEGHTLFVILCLVRFLCVFVCAKFLTERIYDPRILATQQSQRPSNPNKPSLIMSSLQPNRKWQDKAFVKSYMMEMMKRLHLPRHFLTRMGMCLVEMVSKHLQPQWIWSLHLMHQCQRGRFQNAFASLVHFQLWFSQLLGLPHQTQIEASVFHCQQPHQPQHKRHQHQHSRHPHQAQPQHQHTTPVPPPPALTPPPAGTTTAPGRACRSFFPFIPPSQPQLQSPFIPPSQPQSQSPSQPASQSPHTITQPFPVDHHSHTLSSHTSTISSTAGLCHWEAHPVRVTTG